MVSVWFLPAVALFSLFFSLFVVNLKFILNLEEKSVC